MKKHFFILLIIVSPCLVFSQIYFEKGYFIDTVNNRTDCLIKNMDWKNNPTQFDYKLTEQSEIKTQNLSNIQIFAIENTSKYVKATVMMDTSSNVLNNLSHQSNAENKVFTVFLKVLEEGPATLLSYEDSNLKRFFARFNEGAIEPLVYKKYLTNKDIILESAPFRYYLSTILTCDKIGFRDFETLAYAEKDITRLFGAYNECREPNRVTKSTVKQRKSVFLFKVIAGINKQDLKISYSTIAIGRNGQIYSVGSNFSNSKVTQNIGIELESILPFNKNKWAVFIAPSYYSHKLDSSGKANISIYRALEIPLDIRYYMFLNAKNKFFVNSGVTTDIPLIKRIEPEGLSVLATTVNFSVIHKTGQNPRKPTR